MIEVSATSHVAISGPAWRDHLGKVVTEVEGVRRAIEELHDLGTDRSDHVDGR